MRDRKLGRNRAKRKKSGRLRIGGRGKTKQGKRGTYWGVPAEGSLQKKKLAEKSVFGLLPKSSWPFQQKREKRERDGERKKSKLMNKGRKSEEEPHPFHTKDKRGYCFFSAPLLACLINVV